MAAGFGYTVHMDGLDGPVIGTYHYDGTTDLAAPRTGDIIEVEGAIGRWRITAGHPLAPHHAGVVSGAPGELAVERIEDALVAPHGD